MGTKTKPAARKSEAPIPIESARRAQIIACAVDAIVELGFARASVDQIAKRAGVSKGVISYHFPAKDDLTRAIMNGIFAEGREYMLPRILAATTSTERLRTYIESNIAFIDAHRKPLKALIDIAASARTADGAPLLDPAWGTAREEGLTEMLRAGQRSGEFRRFNPRVMALTIIQTIDGISPLLAREPALDLKLLARELTTLFHLATRKEPS